MIILKLILFSAFFAVLSQAEPSFCTYEANNPNLPRASCQFPSCALGLDCQPPDIARDSGIIQFEEPVIRMKRPCPDELIWGGCWEVRKDFTFQIFAFDPSGISTTGVHLVQEVATRRTFKKYWKPAVKPLGSDRFVMKDQIVTYVPLGGRLDVAVYEFCARDGVGNEGCVLPSNLNPFFWR